MVRRCLSVLSFIVLFSGAAAALEFSADTVMTYKEEGTTTGKIYFKTDRFRIEMKSPEEMTMITRIDKKVVWNIMPREKIFMEMPFDPKNRPRVDDKIEGEIERKQIRTETIDGHPTKKYLVTYKSGSRKEKMFQWLATDINFPVKSSAVDDSWVQEYKNIKIGPQPNSLFEVPEGYRKLEMPGGMHFKER